MWYILHEHIVTLLSSWLQKVELVNMPGILGLNGDYTLLLESCPVDQKCTKWTLRYSAS